MPTDAYSFKIFEDIQSFELVRTGNASCDLKIVVKHRREVSRMGFVPQIYESDETVQSYQFSLPKNLDTFRNINFIVCIFPDDVNNMVTVHSENIKISIEVSEGDRIRVAPFNFCVYNLPTPIRPYLNQMGQASIESSEIDSDGNIVMHYQKITPPSSPSFNQLYIS